MLLESSENHIKVKPGLTWAWKIQTWSPQPLPTPGQTPQAQPSCWCDFLWILLMVKEKAEEWTLEFDCFFSVCEPLAAAGDLWLVVEPAGVTKMHRLYLDATGLTPPVQQGRRIKTCWDDETRIQNLSIIICCQTTVNCFIFVHQTGNLKYLCSIRF